MIDAFLPLFGRHVKVYFNQRVFEGIIIDETKNTIKVVVEGKVKIFPKSEIIVVDIDRKIRIKGVLLEGTPMQRFKRYFAPRIKALKRRYKKG